MHSGHNKNTENRRTTNEKPAATGTSSANTRFLSKRPPQHQGLLKGPYYPLVNIPAMLKA
ncbi:MAG TPA: hypothetical protein VG347_24310 [Verrucomicrobiae bacterium]|nr:hypothetical protein [Verrucomicrobiae bacterium]